MSEFCTINPFILAENYRLGIPGDAIPPYAPESYSQCGEDLILVAMLDAQFGTNDWSKILPGIYVDIGCAHPVQISNTYLLYKRGMRGVLVDADESRFGEHRVARPGDDFVIAAITDSHEPTAILCVTTGARELSSIDKEYAERKFKNLPTEKKTVQAIHVNSLLERYADKRIYVLSIDAEGMDLAILGAIDFTKYRPLLIVAEHLVIETPDNPNKMRRLMLEAGYHLVAITAQNLIFLRGTP